MTTTLTAPTRVRPLSNAEYLYRQGAITKKMVRLAARLLRTLGKPTTDDQRARFAQAAYRHVNEARLESYALAVRNMAHTAPGIAPAPLRPYSPQAIETILADLDRENVQRRSRSRVTVSAPDQVTRGKSKATVTTSGQLGSRLARHADAAGREAVIDTAERHGKKVGWARVLSGAENCSRCVMLASRGPAFKTEKSALIASKGVRAGKTFHDHCDCRAVLVREGEDWDGREAFELYEDLWTEATRGYSGHAAELALRRQLDRAEREGWTHQELLDHMREENGSTRDAGGSGGDDGGNNGGGGRTGLGDPDDDDELQRRLRKIGVDTHGDDIDEHEVRFLERFVGSDKQTVDWIPRDRGRRPLPTNDFHWIDPDPQYAGEVIQGSIEVEHKYVGQARYKTIRDRMMDDILKGERRGVPFKNFIIDIGEKTLKAGLINQLGQFNRRNPEHQLDRLWVMSRGQLNRITLAPAE